MSTPTRVPKLSISATRIVASTVGVYAGLLGIEHGFFETLQGNVVTNGTVINAIGPQAGVGGSEPALTIIPPFLPQASSPSSSASSSLYGRPHFYRGDTLG